MNNQQVEKIGQHQGLEIDPIPRKWSQTLKRWKEVGRMRLNHLHILQIAPKVTLEMMISKVRQLGKGEVIHRLWLKYLLQSNKQVKYHPRRNQVKCLHLTDSSIYKKLSSSNGRASIVNLLEDLEQVTSSTARERSLSAKVPSKRKRDKDSLAKS